MARVTVEDCVDKVANRFELVLIAAQRARDISAGATLTVDRDNDKNPVVALREIADSKVSTGDLANAVVQGLQKHVEVDEPEEDDFDSLSSEIAAEMSEAMIADDQMDDAAMDDDPPPADALGDEEEGF